uniref:LRRNT domain-containing protein n=1 Tax=Heterorhabditis bacteriophora TaxID=37862 RepID=A0A1I7WY69_HETBA
MASIKIYGTFDGINVNVIYIYIYSMRQCQCYEDIEEKSQAMHLICKWDQLNATNLESLVAPDLVRTLTIRCPHFSKSRTRPPAGLFQGLHQLYSLIVKNAQLRDIPKALFSYIPNLMTLDMTGNDLRIEPYSLRSLGNLIHLDMSNNSINFLTNTLVSMDKLKVLTMDNNRLTNIDFRRLPEELTDLSLRHNFITTIHYVPNSTSPVIVDLPQITCTHLLHRNQTLNLILADHQNELLCKYSNVCSHECSCCEDEKCPCLSTCPTGCQCYRSAHLSSNKVRSNTIAQNSKNEQ